MPALIIDFNDDTSLPAPIVFIRDVFNNENATPTLNGPLGYTEQTAFGPVDTIEGLAVIRDGKMQHHPPGKGGYQVISQPLGFMACPNGHMKCEFTLDLSKMSTRKWPGIWLIPRDEFDAMGGVNGSPRDMDFAETVKNRLPKTPRNSAFVKPHIFNGQVCWVIVFTGSDSQPVSRLAGWESVQDARKHRIHIDAPTLSMERWNEGWWPMQWADIIPPDWLQKDIVVVAVSTDYQSSDPTKDGSGPTTWEWEQVTLTAPVTGMLSTESVDPPVESPPPPPPPPPVDAPVGTCEVWYKSPTGVYSLAPNVEWWWKGPDGKYPLTPERVLDITPHQAKRGDC